MKINEAPFHVVVTYNGYDRDLYHKINNVARKYKSEETGSGYTYSGERDIGFDFKTEKSMRKFAVTVKKVKRGIRINLQKAFVTVDYKEIK